MNKDIIQDDTKPILTVAQQQRHQAAAQNFMKGMQHFMTEYTYQLQNKKGYKDFEKYLKKQIQDKGKEAQQEVADEKKAKKSISNYFIIAAALGAGAYGAYIRFKGSVQRLVKNYQPQLEEIKRIIQRPSISIVQRFVRRTTGVDMLAAISNSTLFVAQASVSMTTTLLSAGLQYFLTGQSYNNQNVFFYLLRIIVQDSARKIIKKNTLFSALQFFGFKMKAKVALQPTLSQYIRFGGKTMSKMKQMSEQGTGVLNGGRGVVRYEGLSHWVKPDGTTQLRYFVGVRQQMQNFAGHEMWGTDVDNSHNVGQFDPIDEDVWGDESGGLGHDIATYLKAVIDDYAGEFAKSLELSILRRDDHAIFGSGWDKVQSGWNAIADRDVGYNVLRYAWYRGDEKILKDLKGQLDGNISIIESYDTFKWSARLRNQSDAIDRRIQRRTVNVGVWGQLLYLISVTNVFIRFLQKDEQVQSQFDSHQDKYTVNYTYLYRDSRTGILRVKESQNYSKLRLAEKDLSYGAIDIYQYSRRLIDILDSWKSPEKILDWDKYWYAFSQQLDVYKYGQATLNIYQIFQDYDTVRGLGGESFFYTNQTIEERHNLGRNSVIIGRFSNVRRDFSSFDRNDNRVIDDGGYVSSLQLSQRIITTQAYSQKSRVELYTRRKELLFELLFNIYRLKQIDTADQSFMPQMRNLSEEQLRSLLLSLVYASQ